MPASLERFVFIPAAARAPASIWQDSRTMFEAGAAGEGTFFTLCGRGGKCRRCIECFSRRRPLTITAPPFAREVGSFRFFLFRVSNFDFRSSLVYARFSGHAGSFLAGAGWFVRELALDVEVHRFDRIQSSRS